MTPLRYASALTRIGRAVDFGKSGGSCGVWVFKLGVGYWAEPAGLMHDRLYDSIDWTVGSLEADEYFLEMLETLANGDQDKLDEAAILYSVARRWGQARFGAWKVGIRY